MKLKYAPLLGLAVVACLASNASATTLTVGMGSDSSFVILESPNVGLRTYEVFYDFDASNPLGTDDLLITIGSEDPTIMFNLMGDPANPSLESIEFNGVTEGGPFALGAPFWGLWVAGGQNGFDPDDFSPAPVPIPSETWTSGAGFAEPFRIVEPGSSEALLFGTVFAPPTFDPVPEPSSAFLLGAGSLLIIARRKRLVK